MPQPWEKLLTVLCPQRAAKLVSGSLTITSAGTPQRITTVTVPCLFVELSADNGVLAYGDSNAVRATSGGSIGCLIYPGTNPKIVAIDDLSKLWFDARSNGGRLCYNYYLLS